ncbi:hypothetical protein PTKIN_Ptkin03bG0050300 [Pterospermum kingtungense]
MKKVELVFVPTPGVGHLVSTIEFAKRLIRRDDRILITILSMKWFSDASIDALTKSLTVSRPDRIQLIDLPQVYPPSVDPMKSAEGYIYAFIESYIHPVRNAGLPSYIFLTSNAAFLGLMFYPPNRHRQNSSEFENTDPEHLIPGFVNPVPSCVLPSACFNKDGGYTAYLKIGERFMDAKIGPVLDLNGLPHPELDLIQRDKIMKWLDDQPQSAVIFLCFGSFGEPQVKEMALGLEQSGYRFLWSLRVPPQKDASGIVHFKKPEDMLPEGYRERIQGRGMICEWAPQVEVLAHKAIGGFVSHCGWNPILTMF